MLHIDTLVVCRLIRAIGSTSMSPRWKAQRHSFFLSLEMRSAIAARRNRFEVLEKIGCSAIVG
jgi:hypothetical protein